ncbi:MerR family transcriptional regulator [Streptomyces qinzhouensis]|uniref:MerR family transcriptional regulator n=1 Tax=Streptomyces qinzhouensis TaxID=2599401 RepID=A0A5B8IFH5_9ACTN|nr:MerR family transcriptional regulator [Streptomyces qinzhouensis]QDY75969.1 MerR family transcriptional regulator [Streptomyces qinzhouensis]
MRIGELSRRTGVPVPTIKYYLREGLLPAGELTSPNQAVYGEEHERRLNLIRALLDIGGLKIAAIGEVLAAVDDPGTPLHEVLGAASGLLVDRPAKPEPPGPDPVRESARLRVDALVAGRGWLVGETAPGRELLAGTLAAMDRLGLGDFGRAVADYADAAEQVARADLDQLADRTSRAELVETVIVGTVLGSVAFEALRQLARADRSARRGALREPAPDNGRTAAGAGHRDAGRDRTGWAHTAGGGGVRPNTQGASTTSQPSGSSKRTAP